MRNPIPELFSKAKCTCRNNHEPVDGFIYTNPCCEVHRLFPLYQRNPGDQIPVDRGHESTLSRRSREIR